MVDGVFASCYASADHDVSDVVITPIQWLPWITEWVFGDEMDFKLMSVFLKVWQMGIAI